MSDDFIQFINNNNKIYDLIAKELNQQPFLMSLSSISCTFVEAQRISYLNKLDNNKKTSISIVQEKLKGHYK
jgi:hypothetical protein